MGIKSFRPVTPVQRYKTVSDFSEITASTPFWPLTTVKKGHGGRNNNGRITVRHHGGGNKRFLRLVDFKRNKKDIPGVVESIEYDPNRSCRIALVKYVDGERRYILATVNMKPGMQIVASEKCEIAEGNCMVMANIPPGIMVHNIEIRSGKGGQIARSAGGHAIIVAKENDMVQLRFPSGEIRSVSDRCFATVGQVGNIDHMNIVVGSAGRKRHMGIRPRVRGIAMNPVDHPMGGGEGRSKSGGGRQHPESPWGQKAKGLKTRHKKNPSNKYIVKRRGK